MSMNLTLSKGYNPLRQTSLIRPIELRDVPVPIKRALYVDENLTEYEILILEYIGMLNVFKGGSSMLSFQGLKRLLNIHQAKLTKAINRLMQKELLEKIKSAYRLSDEGAVLFSRLYEEFDLHEDRLPNPVYTHVARGRLNGFSDPNESIHRLVTNNLMGKWFGNYRFTAKIEYNGISEICWMSIDGNTSISLLVGPENEVKIAHSAIKYYDAETELQILVDRIAQTIEEESGLIVEISSLTIYENEEIMKF